MINLNIEVLQGNYLIHDNLLIPKYSNFLMPDHINFISKRHSKEVHRAQNSRLENLYHIFEKIKVEREYKSFL